LNAARLTLAKFLALAALANPAPVSAGTGERSAPSPADLPLVEIPLTAGASPDSALADLMAVYLSGDGGWSWTDRGISRILAARGIPVVGLNSLRYFWKQRTPEEAGKDLERLLDHYRERWQRERVVLIGYSMGADVLPFMVNRLQPETRSRIRLVVLLGPSHFATFQFHFGAWVGRESLRDALPLAPEVQQLRGTDLLCVYGDREKGSLCPELDPALARVVSRAGGHLVLWSYAPVADAILQSLAPVGDSTAPPAPPATP
jgi:type IV secretory pathway VirJ component